MPRFQDHNQDGELMSSMFVQTDQDFSLHFGDEPSKTRQEFAEECDINALMARYEKTGVISHISTATPQYLDLSETSHLDLMHSLNVLNEATDGFMSLPAKVRAEFDNDPMKFVEFASDGKNLDQLREWGLAKPAEPTPPPAKVEVINPEALEPKAPGAGDGPAKPTK